MKLSIYLFFEIETIQLTPSHNQIRNHAIESNSNLLWFHSELYPFAFLPVRPLQPRAGIYKWRLIWGWAKTTINSPAKFSTGLDNKRLGPVRPLRGLLGANTVVDVVSVIPFSAGFLPLSISEKVRLSFSLVYMHTFRAWVNKYCRF